MIRDPLVYVISSRTYYKICYESIGSAPPCIIAESQSAFTQGRLISDNILIVYELFHHVLCHLEPNADVAIQLDMNEGFWSGWMGLFESNHASPRISSWSGQYDHYEICGCCHLSFTINNEPEFS